MISRENAPGKIICGDFALFLRSAARREFIRCAWRVLLRFAEMIVAQTEK